MIGHFRGEFIGRGTHRGDLMGIAPTGRPIHIPVCEVLELRDGKIYREREYIDMAYLLTQLGVTRIPLATPA
jgi:predicted ester cyclase